MSRLARIGTGFLAAAGLLLIALAASASHLPLFEENTVLEVTLSGPLERVISDKSGKDEYPFALSVAGIEQDLDVRIRGQSRIRLCDFPPLRLDFPLSRNDAGVFAGQNKLKLVTHCSSSGRSQENLLREYAAYRMLNRLTDASYDVRLLRISYVETGRRAPARPPRYGFVVESSENLAHRLGGAPIAVQGIVMPALDQRRLAIVNLFQYLIGNIDWSLAAAEAGETCCHNVDLFYVNGKYVLVPFDFDLSKIVDARYEPDASAARLQTVRYRKHVGYCVDRATMAAALDEIHAQREPILAEFQALPGVNPKQLRRGVRFLEEFFEAAADDAKFLDEFERDCK